LGSQPIAGFPYAADLVLACAGARASPPPCEIVRAESTGNSGPGAPVVDLYVRSDGSVFPAGNFGATLDLDLDDFALFLDSFSAQ